MTIVVHGPTDRDQFALTFDDGPERGVTDRLLEVLDRHDARATFFCVGDQVEREPGLAREILVRGHEIGCHTMRHLNHHEIGSDEVAKDVVDGIDALERLLEAQLRLYRPPYGRYHHVATEQAERRGLRSIFWSAWGIDWLPHDAQTIASLVLQDLRGGAIVLLHDSARYTERRADCAPTIDATGLVLKAAAERGLRAVTVGHLLGLE